MSEWQDGGAPFGVVDVAGPSMRRYLFDGDKLLVRYGARLRPGAVAVFLHPLQQDLLVIKRAVGRRPGGWWMLSDNPLVRSDSREYGVVPDELVLGRALLRLSPNPTWLAPSRWLERQLGVWPLAGVPGLAARLGARRELSEKP